LFRREVELRAVQSSLATTEARVKDAERRSDEDAARYQVLEHMHTATVAALQREREQSASAERFTTALESALATARDVVQSLSSQLQNVKSEKVRSVKLLVVSSACLCHVQPFNL